MKKGKSDQHSRVRGQGEDLRTIQRNTVRQLCIYVKLPIKYYGNELQKSSPRMQQLPATQAPTLLIPSSRQFNERGCIGMNTYIVSEQPEQLKCVFEYSTIVHGKNDAC